MQEYWKEYWGIIGEPFSEEPLYYNRGDLPQVLVETTSIKTIEKLVEDIAKQSGPRRVYVVGPRGMGKSTVLNYVARQFLDKMLAVQLLPVYVNTVADDPAPEKMRYNFVMATLTHLFQTILRDLEGVNYSNQDMTSFFKDRRDEFLKKWEEGIPPQAAEALLYDYLSLIRSRFGLNGTILLYDELDKLERNPKEIVYFLGRSQGLLENISRSHGFVFIAGVPEWLAPLRTAEYSGIRGHSIELPPWDEEDVGRLVNARYARSTTFPKKNPFTTEAIGIITKQAAGRPREALSLARLYLVLGATERVAQFDERFCNRYVWNPSSVDLFFSKVSQDETLYRGLAKLRSIYDPEKSDRRNYQALLSVFRLGGKLRSDISAEELRRRIGEDADRKSIFGAMAPLESSRAVKKRKENGTSLYEIDRDLKELFIVTASLKESFEFLPYVVRLRRAEFLEGKLYFEVRVAITGILMKNPSLSRSAQSITEEILSDAESRRAAFAMFMEPSEPVSDEYVIEKLRRSVSSTLANMEQQGLVKRAEDRGETRYNWFPRHVDMRRFAGLTLDPLVIQDLEAAEKNFTDGFYDASAMLCRGIAEGAMRSLYNLVLAPEKCPADWHMDKIREALFKKEPSWIELNSKALALQLQTNPIVHHDVIGIEREYARNIIELTHILVKDIYTKIKILSSERGAHESS